MRDKSKKKLCNAHRLRRIEIIFAGVLVVVGIAYTVFAALQWVAMRAQIAITQSQLQSIRDEQRAWVSPWMTRLANPLAVGQKPAVAMDFKNTGKSLAFDTQIIGQVIIIEGQMPIEKMPFEKTRTNMEISKIIVASDMVAGGTTEGDKSLTQEELDGLRNGTRTLYFRGRIEYRDIFNQWHITTFCRWISGANEIDKLQLSACGRGDTAD